MRPGIELAALSDVGCQRENNEDTYSYWEAASDEAFERQGRLISVADGMGGYEGGQEASRLAVQTVEQVYGASSESDVKTALATAFRTANARIRDYAEKHPALHGMGTTCTTVALIGNNLYYSHVGDSRLYLSRDSKILALTRDQSYVGRLVEQGIIRPEEAVTHPQRNILTGALGAGNDVIPEVLEQAIHLEKGDILILCTDGLWSLLSESDIQSTLVSGDLKQSCQKLIAMAKERGGPDNITVEMFRVTDAAAK
jgi:serine/threonine protein phosphatase PrpC